MNTMLRPDVYCVGGVDRTIRDIHGFDAPRGTTYNAYLVLDRSTVLIDAVKAGFAGELLENVATVLAAAGPGRSRTLDYVVCNHAELDHSGALPLVMRAFPEATLVCDKKCVAALARHFDTAAWKFHVVAEGDTLSLGDRTLRFIETPMVHWPESMFTFLPEEKILFSMDAFGQHAAGAATFDDEASLEETIAEAKKYYANIIMPFGKPVAALLDKLGSEPIEIIAPSHGLIWRYHLSRIIDAYRDWCVCRPKAKVLVLYDTMWDSTRQMAEAILSGATQPGIDARLIDLRTTSLTQVATEVFDAASVAVGTATLNRGPMPAVAAALNYLCGLRPAGKTAVAFGSYGWGGGATDAVMESLRSMQWELLGEPIRSKYRPSSEELDRCVTAGRQLAQSARRRSAAGREMLSATVSD